MEKRILEEKNKNESLESYTSVMSHEFKTPISTSILLVEMMKKNCSDSRNLRFLNLVHNSLSFLLCLVNDIVDMKLISSKKF